MSQYPQITTTTMAGNDNDAPTTAAANDVVNSHQRLLDLAAEYRQLGTEQTQLEAWLDRLRQEEQALMQALEQATATTMHQHPGQPQQLPSNNYRRPGRQNALQRLEQALLKSSSDSSSDDSDE